MDVVDLVPLRGRCTLNLAVMKVVPVVGEDVMTVNRVSLVAKLLIKAMVRRLGVLVLLGSEMLGMLAKVVKVCYKLFCVDSVVVTVLHL